MSELAKEKLYRKELIKAGATGDNNVARIRSLAGGGNLQEKTVNPTTEKQVVVADEGYSGLSSVTVNAISDTMGELLRKRITNIESNMNGMCYGVWGFKGVENIILENTTAIMENAFEQCVSLKTITLDRCGMIQANAFNGCTSLESIILKNKLNKVLCREGALDGLSGVITVYVQSEMLSEYEADSNWQGYVTQGIIQFAVIE